VTFGGKFHDMTVSTSSRWTFTLELEDASLKPSTESQALRLARQAQGGTLGATGDLGDCLDMQFDSTHALVLFMAASGPILRPHFPNRKETGARVEEFFCACCGVQLGKKTEMLRCCLSREEGFRVCRAIFHGQLPDAIPEENPKQPRFPGVPQATGCEIEWVELKGRLNSCALR
jgi:hypothetical protein